MSGKLQDKNEADLYRVTEKVLNHAYTDFFSNHSFIRDQTYNNLCLIIQELNK